MREWEAAGRREAIARGQIAVAQEVVEVYRAQFQIGRRNLLDLLNAYAELANAELAFEAAGVDREIARHQIESAIGRLAAHYEQKR
jgi:outer membrane protein TolC